MNNDRKEIIELLRATKRPGIENVINWLDTEPSFFEALGARIHHDNVKGGLAYHSLKVYQLAKSDWEKRDAAFKQRRVMLHSSRNILWRVSPSRPCYTMSARRMSIISMPMAFPHGMRRTTARVTAFAPYACSKNLG